jgi:prephenate dehydrogenase
VRRAGVVVEVELRETSLEGRLARRAGMSGRPTLGILGFGRFGGFLASRLREDFTVVVSDVLDRREEARAAGARWGTVDQVAACRWIVPAVPIGRLRDALADLAPRLAPGATVVEVSSVKTLPSRWLRELLPSDVTAVATHPLFGPDSAARSLKGLPFVVCPLPSQAAAAARVCAYARRRGLRVVRLEAAEHDELMARTQALTFFLSRVLTRLDLPDPESPVGTLSYRRLRASLASVARDTDELYRDLVQLNPHARRFVEDVASAVAAERAGLTRGSATPSCWDGTNSGRRPGP